uniref:Uncharacterized protein n=1 Tax=Anguilla anguilla TaxID=7936 RepID=A0A0E9Y200_ANGAN
MTLLYKSAHSHSTQPPSNSVQTDPLCTALGPAAQISLDDQDMTGSLPHRSPLCSPQTDGGVYVLCWGPE